MSIQFVPLIEAGQVPVGRAVRVEAKGRHLIVCNDAGTFYVADCACPHEGGPLVEGDVRDGCISCPVHYWPWDLKTGLTDPGMPEMRLAVYPCEVRDGTVFADISSPPRSEPVHLDVRH